MIMAYLSGAGLALIRSVITADWPTLYLFHSDSALDRGVVVSILAFVGCEFDGHMARAYIYI
jgi:hypothetical protein